MSKKQISTGIAIVIAVLVVGYFMGSAFFMQQSQQPAEQAQGQGLVVTDETVGTGAAAQPGDTVVMEYTGKLEDGTVFDTSVGKSPIPVVTCPAGTQTGICFTLGAGQVIPGWDQGIAGMKVGGTRTLIVPPELGYGSQDYGPIPANSTLVFEVTLLNVVAAASSTPTAQ